ncbi:copper resistance protein CopB [Pseudomonas taeanensis MS-3]|uniref:Copper resistance protein CopB n=1 Tax=Pseudomonas taeanensis MS-3 TaxID=1395571 RepID=A0A0A1YLQ0_9PSED|nr:copper resistance protein B [Pseudomonas taeanensis]KFX69996.1 copper resistance protein CopB [Pseudomonas taeanensis MS-3]
MTSRLFRPTLIALAVSLGTVTAGMASAAEPMDHSMHSSAAAPAADEAQPASTTKPSSAKQYGGEGAPMDHAAMGHGAMQSTQSGQMGAMDHSKMDQGGAQDAPRTTSRTPIPVLTDADREAAFPPLAGHAVHDDAINSFFLLDQLEYQAADEGSVLSWDASGWIGGDIDRLWLRSEGERTNGVTEDAEIQALWGHSIGPWWDVVGGVRQDFKPSSPQTWAAFGLQGMALYAFEAEATAFIGENGQTAARLEGDYDILLTNRLILQPTAEVNFYGKNDPARGIGSGLANTEVGLRLRYEIRREFAPYIGVTWNRAYGNTADLLREEGGDVSEARFVAGIRMWF